mmetsp:Transcript_24770/g.50881  ORF Transcript_24770/g.50881 Transcript_24770/m.50881 type:complete len:205 (+) Transcript_24770:1204-1818(+)
MGSAMATPAMKVMVPSLRTFEAIKVPACQNQEEKATKAEKKSNHLLLVLDSERGGVEVKQQQQQQQQLAVVVVENRHREEATTHQQKPREALELKTRAVSPRALTTGGQVSGKSASYAQAAATTWRGRLPSAGASAAKAILRAPRLGSGPRAPRAAAAPAWPPPAPSRTCLRPSSTPGCAGTGLCGCRPCLRSSCRAKGRGAPW